LTCQSVTVFRGTLTIRALVMGDGALCYGALENVGLLLLLLLLRGTATLGQILVVGTPRHSWDRRLCQLPYYISMTSPCTEQTINRLLMDIGHYNTAQCLH